MRDYGKVHSSFWSSDTTRKLSDDGRLLALYLLTCSHSTIAGVFRLPDGYVCEDMQWASERVQKGFAELFQNGFCNRCETTKWVFIYKHFDWNNPENPNQWKSANKLAMQVPASCSWVIEFQRVFVAAGGTIVLPNANPSKTLSKPVTVTGTGTGEKDSPSPPKPKGRQKAEETLLAEYLDLRKGENLPPFAADNTAAKYADSIKLPDAMFDLAWFVFQRAHTGDGPSKTTKKKDWAAHFRNAIEKNWYGLWAIDRVSNDYYLTTTGKQAELSARSA